MTSSSKSIPDDRWDLMFRELKQRIAMPTDPHPAARIWRGSDLTTEISQVRKDHLQQLVSTFPPAKTVIERMLAIGWLQEIPLVNPKSTLPSSRLYLLDMEATEQDLPEPLELLQGYLPVGVVCYFSALAFHELTTQAPAFHHIGIPRNMPTLPEVAPSGASPTRSDTKPRDPLGTLVFHYQDTPCYTTNRDASLMPGIQTRELGPRTRLRITTPEQTMLDTLWQPLKCGGQAIAFEAWERGVTRWNPDRMAQHLQKINRQDWDRRVGAMLSLLGVNLESDLLRDRLEATKQHVKRSSDFTPLTLLKNLPATSWLPEWGIFVP